MSFMSLFFTVRTFVKLVFVAAIFLGSLISSFVLYLLPSVSSKVNKFWSSLLMWVFNVRVNIIGSKVKDKPCLFVSNHLSFIDFIVLNHLTPVSFVAKEEISSMPVFGMLARLNRCIFTPRTRRASLSDSSIIAKHLISGKDVAMFPESTTTSGNLIPFHSSMFSAACDAAKELNNEVLVQPISLIYTRKNGLPLNTRGMLSFAWCAGRSVFSMLLDIISAPGSVELYVVYHKPVIFTPETNRKEATIICENAIRASLSNYKKYGVVALA